MVISSSHNNIGDEVPSEMTSLCSASNDSHSISLHSSKEKDVGHVEESSYYILHKIPPWISNFILPSPNSTLRPTADNLTSAHEEAASLPDFDTKRRNHPNPSHDGDAPTSNPPPPPPPLEFKKKSAHKLGGKNRSWINIHQYDAIDSSDSSREEEGSEREDETSPLAAQASRTAYAGLTPFKIFKLLIVAAAAFIVVSIWLSSKTKKADHHPSSETTTTTLSTATSPFSQLHPVHDLKLQSFHRPDDSSPGSVFESIPLSKLGKTQTTQTTGGDDGGVLGTTGALPTNSWYQNLLHLADNQEPTTNERVYTIPYILDMVGPVRGLRVHGPSITASSTVVQLNIVERHGLTLGMSPDASMTASSKTGNDDDDDSQTKISKRYSILGSTPATTTTTNKKEEKDKTTESSSLAMSNLGITLKWGDGELTTVDETTDGLQTDALPIMTSPIVRGMPYATMRYHNFDLSRNVNSNDKDGKEESTTRQVLPSIVSEIDINAPPLVDAKLDMKCGKIISTQDDAVVETIEAPVAVDREVKLIFTESDFTWLVFFSRPVYVRCFATVDNSQQQVGVPPADGKIAFQLQVVIDVSPPQAGPEESNEQEEDEPLTIRMALMNNCTYGGNPMYCGRGRSHLDRSAYGDALRRHANVYPGEKTRVEFTFDSEADSGDGEHDVATLRFNWDAQRMRADALTQDGSSMDKELNSTNGNLFDKAKEEDTDNLLMFALSHHLKMMESTSESDKSLTAGLQNFCEPVMTGQACLTRGSSWIMQEDINFNLSFRAPRPPKRDAVPMLASALQKDIHYKLPDYYMRGAGDTYFSGKMLAKLARILTITEELKELRSRAVFSRRLREPADENNILVRARNVDLQELQLTMSECQKVSLPSDGEFNDALAHLRSGVEVWINGTGDVPFVYDSLWGGLVSCGCLFNGKTMTCDNQFPNCPAFGDPGLDFGNGFYNDHHFHYGYHILAAAVVAHFDPEWGRKHFEEVLLYIRDIANPSALDNHFPIFRHKDWYMGNSWANGISVAYLNGRNQESSSEAIAAYEAVALYGDVMVTAWGKDESSNEKKRSVAKHVRDVGKLLTATELRAADQYYHVRQSDENRRVYPMQYTPHVVGMMWNTMAQFQTWFGNAPYLPYGIQLLPITAVSEQRDDESWAREIYEPFAASCEPSTDCKDQGWSILQFAILATVGHRNLAMKKALSLPPEVFLSAGGNGHSLTNTLWYISTRPDAEPLSISSNSVFVPTTDQNDQTGQKSDAHLIDCGCSDTCTSSALEVDASGYSCGDRIKWLIDNVGRSEHDACSQVGGIEFPKRCGPCDPNRCEASFDLAEDDAVTCPPCTKEVCQGELNLCPLYLAPYLCTKGGSAGGCSRAPWTLTAGQCLECCELAPGCGD